MNELILPNSMLDTVTKRHTHTLMDMSQYNILLYGWMGPSTTHVIKFLVVEQPDYILYYQIDEIIFGIWNKID